ncbi:MAG: hydantoinase/oxoprolinase family protein [Acidimicrobiales bacterium]
MTPTTGLGVDTGGTFTDGVDAQGNVAKVVSTPDDPARAVSEVVAELGGAGMLAHGTTVATNALLERRGATVALVTNRGFADVIEIGRQDRPSLYDPFLDRPEPLVPRHLRFEVDGRLAADGSELEPVGTAGLLPLPEGVDAVAVCLLHSDLDDSHERAVGAVLNAAGHDVSLSVDVSPEFREVERTTTTVVNAYLRAPCRPYLARLADVAQEVLVLTSAAGLLPLAAASELPAALLLSGPAGGVIAGAAVAAANGFPDAVTLDMGGTSSDVCLVRGGVPGAAPGRVVGGFPVRLAALDINTIGAGGGSIASLDPGGALVVGPRSAGAVPGPACYGRGGVEPTVTDADVALGRIPEGHALAGLGALDRRAAMLALDKADVTANGVVAVVHAAMEQAVRAVTVERGVDPRDLALVAFGGAGPLHACAIADALGMSCVVVPARAGVLSAAGILSAPRRRELVRSWPTPSSRVGLAEALSALSAEATALVGAGASSETAVDVRYAGQSHELTVATASAFHEEHRRRNGYADDRAPLEVVAIRARASLASSVSVLDLAPIARSVGSGPVAIAEPDCTIWVPDGWEATTGEASALVLRRRVLASSKRAVRV